MELIFIQTMTEEQIWYSLFVIAITALIGIIRYYIANQNRIIEQLSNTVSKMNTVLEVEKEKLDQLTKRMEKKDLKDDQHDQMFIKMMRTLDRMETKLAYINGEENKSR